MPSEARFIHLAKWHSRERHRCKLLDIKIKSGFLLDSQKAAWIYLILFHTGFIARYNIPIPINANIIPIKPKEPKTIPLRPAATIAVSTKM
jgi:hypothetical protein